jgi:putative PIN family toxin of toxin-antitoxin system
MKIVCDTNVLVSGILFRGHPRRILLLAAQGRLTNVTSPALLREAETVLSRPKFGLRPSQVASILALFRDTFDIVYPGESVTAILDDPADNRVLETAGAAAADVIVSGDQHLLRLKEWRGIRVLSPADLATELRRENS